MQNSNPLQDLANHRGAIVVATGGHLEQAIRRVNQLGLTNSVTFFTGNNSQSTSKLAGYQHEFIRNVGSRDLIGLVRSLIQLAFKLKKSEYKYVLSTGAGVAIACALVCKMKRIQFYYVESIARQNKPSLTGRVLEKIPSANLYTESSSFNSSRWKSFPSFFSEYQMIQKKIDASQGANLKIFVTLGTVNQFRFPRLIELVNSVLQPGDSVIWQVGNYAPVVKFGEVIDQMSSEDFIRNIKLADVVISHAGVGSLLNTLDSGKSPILVPRLAQLNEHIDDHQVEIAARASAFNLAIVVTNQITRQNLIEAKSRSIFGSEQKSDF